MKESKTVLKPGNYLPYEHALRFREQFDLENEEIVTSGIPVDFVFIGDSLTEAWNLQEYFGEGGKKIVNRGIGGDKPLLIAKRFPADALQLKPEYIVLMAGINETWVLDDKEHESRKDEVIEAVKDKILSGLQSMVDMSLYAGLKLILCSILPTNIPSDRPGSPTNHQRNQLIMDVNQRLREIAVEKGVVFIDYHAVLVGEDGRSLRENYTEDGIHINRYGYEMLAKVVYQTLKKCNITI